MKKILFQDEKELPARHEKIFMAVYPVRENLSNGVNENIEREKLRGGLGESESLVQSGKVEQALAKIREFIHPPSSKAKRTRGM